MEVKVCQGKQGKLPFKVSSWHVTRILPRAPEADDAAVAASSRRPRSSPAANTELCSCTGTAFQSSPGQENYSTQRFRAASGFSSPHLYYTGSDCTERAAGPGREQGTCTSEACGTNWLQNRSK